VHRNFRFRFPQSLRHVGKRKREAIKKRDCNSIHFRDPAHTLDEIRRDLARLAMVREQIGLIEQARVPRQL
jgi:hypothetical protein